MDAKRRIPVCPSEALGEGHHIGIEVRYEDAVQAVILFRYQGRVFAYLNRCLHMGHALDAESPSIFDDNAEYLRCSVHGAVYNPATGECGSTLCNGERLRPVRLTETDGAIYITDKRARPVED
jgi:nitrite reductase/ring-hydroxylating ferredoxin subunit